MSALAIAFHKDGWQVSGSDVGFYPPISDYLKDNNILFYPGWHPEKMTANGDPDIVVVGNVAGTGNAEFIYARKHNFNYKSYPEVIAEYIVQKKSLVCAGTYGKTSTSALLTFILEKAGINPSYMFGGLSLNLPESAKIKLGSDSWSVLEGDEYKTARWDSRPKFKLYSPTHLLLTSVSWDHADIYPTEETYLQAFKDLVSMIPAPGLIVACADDSKIKKVLTANINGAKEITYGKDPSADYYYSQVTQTTAGISFIIKHKDTEYNISAPVLGEHMAENICGCFAMAEEILAESAGFQRTLPGMISSNLIILDTVAEFKGIKRRLEKRSEGKITVYDDLGHSPAKAAATLKTLHAIYPNNKIIAIFEPNTGNRKSQSIPGYAGAFADADEVIIPTLTRIKTDPKDIDPPFDGKKLTEIISRTQPQTVYIENDDKLIEYVKNNTKKEDTVVFLGSHGFRGMIERLIANG